MKRDKYPHLNWYIESARTVAALQFALCGVVGIAPIIIAIASGEANPTGAAFAAIVTVPFCLCIGYILYKMTMAGADFLCVFRDIETNTGANHDPQSLFRPASPKPVQQSAVTQRVEDDEDEAVRFLSNPSETKRRSPEVAQFRKPKRPS